MADRTQIVVRQVAVCVTCQAVVSRGREVDPYREQPPSPDVYSDMVAHQRATGHRECRIENRLMLTETIEGET